MSEKLDTDDLSDPFETGDGMVSIEDLINIGRKVVEMADRAKKLDPAVPGALATWAFEDENTRFLVTVKVQRD